MRPLLQGVETKERLPPDPPKGLLTASPTGFNGKIPTHGVRFGALDPGFYDVSKAKRTTPPACFCRSPPHYEGDAPSSASQPNTRLIPSTTRSITSSRGTFRPNRRSIEVTPYSWIPQGTMRLK